MDANRTPCSIVTPASRRIIDMASRASSYPKPKWVHGRGFEVTIYDFSPWITAEALAAFDPTGREAGEFMLEIAKAAAVNNEREWRRAARGGSV